MTSTPLTCEKSLVRHKAPVNFLTVSECNQFLLSGDDNSVVFVSDIMSSEVLHEIHLVFFGQVSCGTWFSNDENTLCFAIGCADGSIHVYRSKKNEAPPRFLHVQTVVGHDGIVQDIKYSKQFKRLASCGGSHPQVWTFTQHGGISPEILSPPRSQSILKNIVFLDEGATILVCELESHLISCYTVEPFELKWSKTINTRIGHAEVCNGELAVSNLVDGVDIYALPLLERLRKYRHPISKNKLLQITFANNNSWLVCGGDMGFARLFDAKTGESLAQLEHRNCHLIQTACSFMLKDEPVVLTACTDESETGGEIKIWRPPRLLGQAVEHGSNFRLVNMLSSTLFWLLAIIIFIPLLPKLLHYVLFLIHFVMTQWLSFFDASRDLFK